jgi:hypothetical protein
MASNASSTGSSSFSLSPSPPKTGTISSSNRFKHVPVLVGTLIPGILILLAGTIYYRRRRSQRPSSSPDTEARSVPLTAISGSQRSTTKSTFDNELLKSTISVVSTLGSVRFAPNRSKSNNTSAGEVQYGRTLTDVGALASGSRSNVHSSSSPLSASEFSESLSRSPSVCTNPPPEYDSETS